MTIAPPRQVRIPLGNSVPRRRAFHDRRCRHRRGPRARGYGRRWRPRCRVRAGSRPSPPTQRRPFASQSKATGSSKSGSAATIFASKPSGRWRALRLSLGERGSESGWGFGAVRSAAANCGGDLCFGEGPGSNRDFVEFAFKAEHPSLRPPREEIFAPPGRVHFALPSISFFPSSQTVSFSSSRTSTT